MKISKTPLQNALNSFSGVYREIFLESSKTFVCTCVNGVFRTPTFSSLSGGNILARAGKKEYFSVFSYGEDIEKKAQEFRNNFSLWEAGKSIELSGEEKLEIPDIEDIHFDTAFLIETTGKLFEEYITNIPEIVASEIGISLSQSNWIVGNSNGKFATDSLLYVTYFIKIIGEKDGKREEVFEKITGTDILDTLTRERLQKLFIDTIHTLQTQLDAEPSPSGKIDVVIANTSGGTIIHEAVGHGLEADLQNSSVYKGKIGQKVADARVTIVDNPTTPHERGFYRYDHEGNPAQNTILIENGVLKSYLHSEKTAQKFATSSTGHARRQNYHHKTLVRMGNTYMLPGTDKKEDLIEKISFGLYVTRMWGGQVNTTTGDFVFKVQNGTLIENGKLTTPVIWATLSGNGPNMIQEIYGVCDDLEFFDGGTCGKWQTMPVSDGVPTFWTKLKVSWIG